MTAQIYAVGDLHGHLRELDRALDLIDRDGGTGARVVFLGDYVDRGPDSRGVLQRLIDGGEQGRDWITLKGNHDRMFEWFVEHPPRHDPHMLVGIHWFHDVIGGVETMASYGVDIGDRSRLKDIHARALDAVPRRHADFLSGLRLFHETADHIFVHAGLRPGVPLVRQDEDDLLWIRDEFHRHSALSASWSCMATPRSGARPITATASISTPAPDTAIPSASQCSKAPDRGC